MMQRSPLIRPSHTPVVDVIHALNLNRVSVALIVDNQRLVGLFTDRDVIRAVATGLPLDDTEVAFFMTHPVVTLSESEAENRSIVLAQLRSLRVPYLPVVDYQGQVVGLITPESVQEAAAQLQQAMEQKTVELEREIGQRRRLVQLLAQGEARYRAAELKLNHILNRAAAAITSLRVFANRSWAYEYISAGCEVVYGYRPEEFLSDVGLWEAQIPAEDWQAVVLPVFEAVVAERPTTIEHRFHHKDGSLRWISMSVTSQYQPTADYWVAISVATDITDRKQLEVALRRSETKLDQILNSANASIVSFRVFENREFEYDYLSAGCEAVYGFTAQELMADKWLWRSRIFPDDLPAVVLAEDAPAAAPTRFSYRFYHKDGSLRWISNVITSCWDEDEHCWHVTIIESDITEFKRLKTALQASEAKLNQILNSAKAAIASFRLFDDQTIQFDYVSAGCVEVFGFTAEEFVNDPFLWRSRVFPDDLQTLFPEGAELRAPGECSYRFYHKDGSLRWIANTLSMQRDQRDRCWVVTAVDIDISERKRLETALQTSETRLNDIFNSATAVILSFRAYADRRWEYEHCSAGCEAVYGYTAEELTADPMMWMSMVYPDDVETIVMPAFETIFAEQSTLMEFRCFHRDGSLRWISQTLTSRRDPAADCWIVTVVALDVTARKQAEAALHQSEERFRQLAETIDEVFFIVSPDLNQVLYISPAYERIWGQSCESLYQNPIAWLDRVHPDDRQALIARLPVLLEGERTQREWRIVRPEGEVRWIFCRTFPVFDDSGQLRHQVGLAVDITERKQLELALQRSQARLNDILNSAIAAIKCFRFYPNSDWSYEYMSAGCEAVFGYRPAEFMADKALWRSRIPPEYLESVIDPGAADIFAEHSTINEYQFRHKDGSLRWITDTLFSRRDPAADSWLVTVVATDITERKQAEAALQQSEARYRAIVEDQTELVCRYLPDTRLSFVNQAYCRYFGRSAEQLLNRSFMELIPEADRPGAVALVESLTADQPIASYEHRVLLASGELRWTRWTDRAIFDDRGEIVEYQCVGWDITERKQAEVQLQASLREKEALLQEVHHRVKNNLQLVSSLLNLQAELTENGEVRQILEDSWSRVDSMALVHEYLYRARNLSSINFSEYIQSLAAHLFYIYSIRPERIQLRIEADAQVSLDLDRAIPCGLILNELLTNALKYGFQAGQRGEIRVSLFQYSSSQIALAVQNSGNTLPADFDLNSTQSLGLRLVKNLIEQLEGVLEVEQQDPTLFRVVFSASTEADRGESLS